MILHQQLFGQDLVTDGCDLKNKNIEWTTCFENEVTIKMKLRLIREKIIADSIYGVLKPKLLKKCHPSIFAETVDSNGKHCGVKILFILRYTKKKSVILDLNKNPDYICIVEKLNEIKIESVFPIFGRKALALYGSLGQSGVVILTTKNKQLRKQIRFLLRKKQTTNGSSVRQCNSQKSK